MSSLALASLVVLATGAISFTLVEFAVCALFAADDSPEINASSPAHGGEWND